MTAGQRRPMLHRLAADAVLLLHLAFVVFVVLGGFLVLRWRKVAWAHLPAVAWGALVEFSGWICPLTPLENALFRSSGEPGYQGDFLAHYLLRALYPQGLTRTTQLMLGGFALAVNVLIYAAIVPRSHRP